MGRFQIKYFGCYFLCIPENIVLINMRVVQVVLQDKDVIVEAPLKSFCWYY